VTKEKEDFKQTLLNYLLGTLERSRLALGYNFCLSIMTSASFFFFFSLLSLKVEDLDFR
jgi:hypothetical protein